MNHNPNLDTKTLLTTFLSARCHNTATAYHLDLFDFAKYLINTKSITQACHRLLANGHREANDLAINYRNHLIERRLQPATVNRRLATLRALVKLAINLGLIDWQLRPDKLPNKPYRDTTGPTPGTIAQMLEHLAQQQTAIATRNIAILRLLFDLGLRRGEVTNLDLVDLDLNNDTIAVTAKGQKHKDALTLPDPTKRALIDWLGVRGYHPGPLFLSATSGHRRRITGKAIWRMIRNLGHLLGTTVRPHGLRHAAITEALNQTNGNVRAVQRFSRHKDVRVVLAYDDNRSDVAAAIAASIANSV